MALPLYAKVNEIGLILKGEDEDKLQRLTAAINYSKPTSSSKSTYALHINLMKARGVVVGSYLKPLLTSKL